MKYIGLLSSAASGKLAGVVASHNRGGTYFRHHSIPTQPRTASQRLQRAQLAGFSAAFKSLTATQIAGWNALGSTVSLKSKLGTTYHPTGQQLFVSCNRHLAQIGVSTQLSTAPTIPSIPAISAFNMTQPTPGATVNTLPYTISPALPSNYGLVIKATSVMSTGRTFAGKSLYRTLAGYSAANAAPSNLLSIYLAKFGPLPQSGIISFELRMVDPVSGFQGPAVTSTVQFSQPVGSDLFSITASPATLSIGTGTIAVTTTITDNAGFTGAASWNVLGLPAGATFTIVPNPDAAAPTITVSKGTLTTADEGTYQCSVQASYGTFVATAAFTLTVAA
jgi:hypothetical protein